MMMRKTVFLVGMCIWYFTVLAEGLQKRVINGVALSDRSTASYAAMKYFVWIGFGRSVSGWNFFLPPREWQFDRQVCGGALLTTNVIQTACHCFAEFLSPRDRYGWGLRNSHHFEVVEGWNVVNDAPQPTGIVKYQIHPMCATTGSGTSQQEGFITHDYALATLETEVQLLRVVTTAPVYPLLEMAEMWSHFVAKEAVCLVMGFGRCINRDVNIKSRVLLHGWQAITSYEYCYSVARHTKNMTQYQKDATWSCMLPFGPKKSLTAKGDSGSPVTCDNHYFSLVSGSTYGADGYDDLVYYAFANSLEYRGELIRLMNMEYDSSSLAHKYIDTPDRWTPGTAPPNFFVAASSGYALKIDLTWLLYSSTILVMVHC